MKWRTAGRSFLVWRGMAAQPAGEESSVPPLRQTERGEAGCRSDMPNRDRVGRAPRDKTTKGMGQDAANMPTATRNGRTIGNRSRHTSRQNDCCIGHPCDPGQPHRVSVDRTGDRKRENRHLSECDVLLASLRGCCRRSALAPRDVDRQVARALRRRALSSRSMVTVMGPTAPWAAIRASLIEWTPAPSDSARRRLAEGGPPSAPTLERESIMPPPPLRLLEPAEGCADRSRRVVHVPPPEKSPACRH